MLARSRINTWPSASVFTPLWLQMQPGGFPHPRLVCPRALGVLSHSAGSRAFGAVAMGPGRWDKGQRGGSRSWAMMGTGAG